MKPKPRRQESTSAAACGRFRLWHFGMVVALLVLPVVAVIRTVGPELGSWVGGWCLAASLFTFLAYWHDKRLAQGDGWRTPEATLHLLELLGGWPGAFLAQRRLRHKTIKGSYQFVYWLIVGAYELVALDALRGWVWFSRLAGG